MTKKEKAERKPLTKRGKISLIFALIWLVAMTVFFIALGLTIPYIIFMVICVVVAFFTKKKEEYEKTCKKCELDYDFDRDISYNEIRNYKKVTNKEAKGPREVLGVLRHEIEFVCTCSQCGEEKRYKKKIDGAKVYGDGHVEHINVEKSIEDYYKTDKNEDVPVITIVVVAGIAIVFVILAIVALVL